MSGHAERSRREARPRGRRPEFDRAWLGRIALAVIVALALALVTRVSMMAFSGGGNRTERYEREGEREQFAPLPREAGAPR